MKEYRTKLGEDGRIIIPAVLRKALELHPGEELLVRLENNELHLLALKHSLKKAQEIVKSFAKKQSLVDKLYKLRQADD